METVYQDYNEKKYSIIVPHKNSFLLLLKLLDTIPYSPDIEVIVIDDNSNEEEKKQLKSYRFDDNISIHYHHTSQGAGKARNIGIEKATGKWLIFADADDFFVENMRSVIDPFFDAAEDIIYFGTTSVYNNNTSLTAFRHVRYLKLVTDFIQDEKAGDALKYHFNPPWGKMIRRKPIIDKNIRFEEIIGNDDILFSITSAHNARSIKATADVLYIITVTEESLSFAFNKNLFDNKFKAALRANDLLRSVGKHDYQQSVLYFIARSHKFGAKYMLSVLKNVVKHRSNLLIGMEKLFTYRAVLQTRENKKLTSKSVSETATDS